MDFNSVIYEKRKEAVFLKVEEQFGGLSNMAPFPLRVSGIRILTSEALYQACRFPHLPDVQKKIIDQKSPMSAKMVGKPYKKETRNDWEDTKVDIMRWCLRIKLSMHPTDFGNLLLSTGDKEIVEQSNKDPFWGAKCAGSDLLEGRNILGKLLVEFREELKSKGVQALRKVPPLTIPDFDLFGKPIGTVG
jgi:type I restriction enzyme S subunit